MLKKYFSPLSLPSYEDILISFGPIYDELIRSQKKVVFYSFSSVFKLIAKRFDLTKINLLALADQSDILHNSSFQGIPIISPSRINSLDASQVIIFSVYYQAEISDYLKTILNSEINIVSLFNFSFCSKISNLKDSFSENDCQWIENFFKPKKQYLFLIEDLVGLEEIAMRILRKIPLDEAKFLIIVNNTLLSKAMQERGIKIENLNLLFDQYKDNNDFNRIETEKKSINEFSNNSFFESLTFDSTSHKLIDSIFYDRLIFPLTGNLEKYNFLNSYISEFKFDEICYFGSGKSLLYNIIINQPVLQNKKSHIFLSGFNNERLKNYYLEDDKFEFYLNEQYTGVFPQENNAKVKFYNFTDAQYFKQEILCINNLSLIRQYFKEEIVIVLFSLEKQWESRVLVAKLLGEQKKNRSNNLIILKCRDSMHSFDGYTSEGEFCKRYFMKELVKFENFKIIDDEIGYLELIDMTSAVYMFNDSIKSDIAKSLDKKVIMDYE